VGDVADEDAGGGGGVGGSGGWAQGNRVIQTSKGKHFFFEKKKQKTFVPSPLTNIQHAGAGAYVLKLKVFWFFFSKKNCFLP
jgi:hypothetical protein